jgi:hypothetical protein
MANGSTQASNNGRAAQGQVQGKEAQTVSVTPLVDEIMNLPPMTEDEVDKLLREQNENALGPSIAIVGFWNKAAGSILAGQIIAREERASTFRRGEMDQIVYVQGIVFYAKDVFREEEGEVIEAGTKEAGVFAYQIDTPSAMVWTRKLGSRLRATMREGLVDIGQGRQRYDYAEIRCVQPETRRAPPARQAPAPTQGQQQPERAGARAPS